MTGGTDAESVGSRREILLVDFGGAQVLHMMKAELAQQGRYLMGLKKELEGLAGARDTGSKRIEGGSCLRSERIRRNRIVKYDTRPRAQTRDPRSGRPERLEPQVRNHAQPGKESRPACIKPGICQCIL